MVTEMLMKNVLLRLFMSSELTAAGYAANGVTVDAVVDADVNQDGKLDDNPDTGTGNEPGLFTIKIHKKISPTELSPDPVLVVDERAVAEFNFTTVEQLYNHIMSQLLVD